MSPSVHVGNVSISSFARVPYGDYFTVESSFARASPIYLLLRRTGRAADAVEVTLPFVIVASLFVSFLFSTALFSSTVVYRALFFRVFLIVGIASIRCRQLLRDFLSSYP